MKYFFHPEAEIELIAAIDYYESLKIGLGFEFSIEVYSTIENIVAYPNAWPLLYKDIRRCLTQRFPYGIIYHINKDTIFVLAIMHLHRKPFYWKNRSGPAS